MKSKCSKISSKTSDSTLQNYIKVRTNQSNLIGMSPFLLPFVKEEKFRKCTHAVINAQTTKNCPFYLPTPFLSNLSFFSWSVIKIQWPLFPFMWESSANWPAACPCNAWYILTSKVVVNSLKCYGIHPPQLTMPLLLAMFYYNKSVS